MENFMQIHTVKAGECAYSIARDYGISPTKLIEVNSLRNPDRLTVGRELLILTPTRTYTAKRGDTLQAISRRFFVGETELMRNNPTLFGKDKLYPEEILAVKYPEKRHGIALLNGYLYKGYGKDRLSLLLPYLSHLTLSSFLYKNGRLVSLFDTREATEMARAAGVRVIMRICSDTPYSNEAYGDNFSEMVISEAKRGKLDGVSLSLKGGRTEDFEAFAFDIKKKALAQGLSLFWECDGKISERCEAAADSVVINFDSLAAADTEKAITEGESFGERSAYESFAKTNDTTRAFIDLSPFAYSQKRAIPIEDAEAIADSGAFPIAYDERGMLSAFETRGGESFRFPSLKNIKARLDLAAELGYLGYCIDVTRCPISHLLMLNGLFSLSPRYFSAGT